jgi:hypothetical protein
MCYRLMQNIVPSPLQSQHAVQHKPMFTVLPVFNLAANFGIPIQRHKTN